MENKSLQMLSRIPGPQTNPCDSTNIYFTAKLSYPTDVYATHILSKQYKSLFEYIFTTYNTLIMGFHFFLIYM